VALLPICKQQASSQGKYFGNLKESGSRRLEFLGWRCDGDGFDDLIVGAPYADPNGQERAGESYVVFGSGSGFDASFNLAELNGSNGFVLSGIDERDFSGGSVSTAGDINDDGFDDLLIGAPLVNPNGQSGAGESYVVFGRDFNGQSTFQADALLLAQGVSPVGPLGDAFVPSSGAALVI